MGTKNNPGEFDCYANAAPDEPMFILLGRDPVASVLVRMWVLFREATTYTGDPRQLEEARDCADAMMRYACSAGKERKVFHAIREYQKFLAGKVE